MLECLDRLMNLVKKDTFLPEPTGPWEVGYVDIMTQGLPSSSSFLRLYYPTNQKHVDLADRCPVWTQHNTKQGFISFLQAMVNDFPSWVNNSEFEALGLARGLNWISAKAFTSAFSLGWGALAHNSRIPVIHQAQLADGGAAWPLAVFSHGMGCNRFTYSKVCYDLCSEGFIVASVEHREGSACYSRFVEPGSTVEIPHQRLGGSEDEYTVRHQQILQRANEVSAALDILTQLNAGDTVHNVLKEEAGYNLQHLAGTMNFDSCYMLGHSFGGGTALLAASRDDRFKAVLAVDPWMFPVSELKFSVDKPVLMVNTEHFVHKNNVAKVREVCKDLDARVIEGAVHLVHTDAPLLFSCNILKRAIGMKCSRDTETVLAENHQILHSWIRSIENQQPLQKTKQYGV